MERIILDVDTGHDDAVAIEMAAGNKDKIKVEALIATAGNAVLENTLNNTLNLADALGLNVPVYKGSSGPLLRDQVTSAQIHGKNGFEGPVFGKRKLKAQEGNFVKFIIDTVMANPKEITFVSVGPWTDLAIALKAEPKLASNLKAIVLMGGTSGMGNITPSAEFNVYADPEAADIVFCSGAPIFLMPLDCTLQVILTPAIQKRLFAIGGKAIEIFKASMKFYVQSCRRYIHDYPAMHDPCTIAFLINPSIFQFTGEDIRVETKGSLTYGRTCLGRPNPDSNIRFARKVDRKAFWDILASSFENLKQEELHGI